MANKKKSPENECSGIAKEESVLKTGTVRTIVLPGGAKMEMIYCAPGTFMMGSPKDEEGREDNEIQHKVTLTKGFWLGKYPVTESQWVSVMRHNPVVDGKTERERYKCVNLPVCDINWKDCEKFIKKIKSISHLAARFPTEAEWEYACRAGSGAACSGTGNFDDMGWHDIKNGMIKRHPVGKKMPNEWGFYDMYGGLSEWCADLYESYPRKAVTDPNGPSSIDDARLLRKDVERYQFTYLLTREFHVLRGGRRSAERDIGIFPCNAGFRLCCSEELYKYRGTALRSARKDSQQTEMFVKEKKVRRIAKEKAELKSGNTKTFVLPGGAEMEMIYCAPGTFMMGSPKDEAGRKDDEILHKVTLTKGFWLGKYPVTEYQWESVMQGSVPPRFSGGNRSRNLISWDDCKKFIMKINSKSDFTARFPTEAEWEYACRAGSRKAYSGTGNLDDMGWYRKNRGKVKIHPVGKKMPNDWGFYDMHGNVWEWCDDLYMEKYPTEATDPKGLSSEECLTKRVVRGGSWLVLANQCRSAHRKKYWSDTCLDSCGFRLCCEEG